MRWWEPRNGCVEVEMMKMLLLLLLLQATGSQKPKVSRSRWRGEAEDEARWIIKKNEKRRTDSHGRKSGKKEMIN